MAAKKRKGEKGQRTQSRLAQFIKNESAVSCRLCLPFAK
ncbi:hypothetical protein COLO4_11523 [Corchorus olitorius]|uniref:Uncharacterized protein n=1 Tax=Corchorus olitorius TaxID=93759 RepID=A0A1R3K427_9ROSI|nr:hypothetical protein COLO4_11523 [Corchorus olitorius]